MSRERAGRARARRSTRAEGVRRRRLEARIRWASLATLVCLLIGAVYLIPLAWVLSVSFRSGDDVFTSIFVPHSFSPGNYTDAWNKYGLGVLFVNSTLITVGTVVISLRALGDRGLRLLAPPDAPARRRVPAHPDRADGPAGRDHHPVLRRS